MTSGEFASEVTALAEWRRTKRRELGKRRSITHVGLVILACLAFWALAATLAANL